MRPVVGGLQQEYPDQFRFRSYDFDVEAERIEAQSVHGLPVHPSFALYAANGQLVERIIGAIPEDALREKIIALLNK